MWGATVIVTFAHEIAGLAIPLTAALLLQASPAQMGMMVALGVVPFALFSLPVGVWLDRRSKFPIVLRAELLMLVALATVPLAYWLGFLSMPWMYLVVFLMGICNVIGGSANQVFLTFLVGRDHLIDAHSKFAATDSAAKLLGPGIGGMLVQAMTAPFALLVDALVFLGGWLTLKRVQRRDPTPPPTDAHPVRDMLDGVVMIRQHPLLWPLAWSFACFQILFNGYAALSILFATRELGMSAGMVGSMQMFGGLGVLLSSALVKPCTRRFGSGVTILMGMGGTALVWLVMPLLPATVFGSALAAALCYGLAVFVFDCSVMLLIMPYIALRQRVTPDAFLGRMTATMRFMTVAAAPLGALSTGWIAEHYGIRSGLMTVGVGAALLTLVLIFKSPLRTTRAN